MQTTPTMSAKNNNNDDEKSVVIKDISKLIVAFAGVVESDKDDEQVVQEIEQTFSNFVDRNSKELVMIHHLWGPYGWRQQTGTFDGLPRRELLRKTIRILQEMENIWKAFQTNNVMIRDQIDKFFDGNAVFQDTSFLRGETVLYCACKCGKLDLVAYLVETYSCDVNIPCTKHGKVPLHAAIENSYSDICKYLLKHGAKPSIHLNPKTDSPKTMAKESSSPVIKKLFTASGKPVRWQKQCLIQDNNSNAIWEDVTPDDAESLEAGILLNESHVAKYDLINFVDQNPQSPGILRRLGPYPDGIGCKFIWEWCHQHSASWNPFGEKISNDLKEALMENLQFTQVENEVGKLEIDFEKFEWSCIQPKMNGFIRWHISNELPKAVIKEKMRKSSSDILGETKAPATSRRTSEIGLTEDESDDELDEDTETTAFADIQPLPRKLEKVEDPTPVNFQKETRLMPDKYYFIAPDRFNEKGEAFISVGGNLVILEKKGNGLVLFGTPDALDVAEAKINGGDLTESVDDEGSKIKRPPKPEFGQHFDLPSDPIIDKFLLTHKEQVIISYLKSVDSAKNTSVLVNESNGQWKLEVIGTPAQHQEAQAIFQRIWNQYDCYHTSLQQVKSHYEKLVANFEKFVAKQPVPRKAKEDWMYYQEILSAQIKDLLKLELGQFQTNLSKLYSEGLMSCCTSQQGVRNMGTCKETAMKYRIMDTIQQQARTSFMEAINRKMRIESSELNSRKKEVVSYLQQSLCERNDILLMNIQDMPTFLHKIQIFLIAAKRNYPLFDHIPELVDRLKAFTVLQLKTDTGSGKSTLFPVILWAAGFGDVCVTQPRRLPCSMISEHIENVFGEDITGWMVSGEGENTTNPILYVTDGLLREWLISDPALSQLKRSVIMLDEVHERGANIDLCAALLARTVKTNPHFKVVLSSATLDPEIKHAFKKSGLYLAEYEIKVPSPYPVKVHQIPGKDTIRVVEELVRLKKRGEQILAFLPTQKEVDEAVMKFGNGIGKAFALYANQPPVSQKKWLEEGDVFFSTNISETSLTFPNLRFVVDCGKSNILKYNETKQANELTPVISAKSTMTQRKGRLGRTGPGDYYVLIDTKQMKMDYPESELQKINLIDLEWSFWRSNGKGLVPLAEFLPQQLAQKIDDARIQLQELGLIANGQLTAKGKQIAKYQ